MTIYALSSGPGVSGVAVIRISGSETSKVIKKLTNKEIPQPRMATLRKINNINTSELIDEGIIIWFPGPESYTGEDMAEIHVHGGKAVVVALQNEISKVENCRLAEPGEFTKLAFQNDKIFNNFSLKSLNFFEDFPFIIFTACSLWISVSAEIKTAILSAFNRFILPF